MQNVATQWGIKGKLLGIYWYLIFSGKLACFSAKVNTILLYSLPYIMITIIVSLWFPKYHIYVLAFENYIVIIQHQNHSINILDKYSNYTIIADA